MSTVVEMEEVTDRNGIPLVIKQSAANRHDTTMFAQLIDSLPTVARKRRRPRWKPDKAHADKAYDRRATSAAASLAGASRARRS